MASAAPGKSTGLFIAKRVAAFLREIGCENGTIVVKSDQDPANIVSRCGGRTSSTSSWCRGRYIVESSPVGSIASNGKGGPLDQPSRRSESCDEDGSQVNDDASDHDMDGEERRLRVELVRVRRRREKGKGFFCLVYEQRACCFRESCAQNFTDPTAQDSKL